MSVLILIGAFCVSAVSQTAASKYEVGTIMAVQPHKAGPNDPASVRRYEISVKVGITLYVVLYDRRPGAIRPEYQIGLSLPVLVKDNTMTFHDRQLGRTRHLLILSRKTIPENNGLMQFFV
jgi:hypothetical protein